MKRDIREITKDLTNYTCTKVCKYAARKDLTQNELKEMCMVCELHELVAELREIQPILTEYRMNALKLHELLKGIDFDVKKPNEESDCPWQE